MLALGGSLVLIGCASAPSVPATALPSASVAAGSPANGTPVERPSPRVTASASVNPTPTADLLTSRALQDAVTADSIHAHLAELQRIADSHAGNRAAGTAGHEASAEYVATRLAAVGYSLERQHFSYELDGILHTSFNLIAERTGRDGARVITLGAHLDSIPGGPGINDNGSGTMTLLVLAERLAEFGPPRHTVRFAFWGAEEPPPGTHGSTFYVESLAPDGRERLVAYLNFDMLGSPNYIRFVYAESQAAPGSDEITRIFGEHFAANGLAWEPIDLRGASDHGAFIRAGIPTGGLFSGGSADKTDAQAAIYGGVAGVHADACSHRACDTISNVSLAALDEMADAVAHAIATLAEG